MTQKKLFLGGFFLILLAIVIIAGILAMNRTSKTNDYSISTVEYGEVFTSVPATGILNAKNEVILLSPASTLVSSMLVSPGSEVSKGNLILTLDPKALIQEIELLKDQLNVMENDLLKNFLNARSTRVDLDYNVEVKKLRITSLKTEIHDQEQLLKVGGISPALHEQTKEELVLAEKDLNMTLEKNSIRLKQLEADERGLQLQINIKRKELRSREDLLGRLNVKAPSDGIIIATYTSAGEKVDKDKLLVKMSDLSSFKVKASVENKYINAVRTGGEVYADIENKRLKGRIGNIAPILKDKKIEFDVFLEDSYNRKLMPNMEVNLQIVLHQKDSVLRVKYGPAFSKNRMQDIFVIEGSKAVNQKVDIGVIGTEYVEILDGLVQGDRVIISDIPRSRQKDIILEDLK